MSIYHQRGFGLVEVLVGAAVILLIILSLFSIFTFYLRVSLDVPRVIAATLLAEEGVEAIKYIRDSGWDENIAPLSLDTPYYLATTSTAWTTTVSPHLDLGLFTRTVLLHQVNRDVNGNIALSGGTLDSGTKKVVVTVTWPSASGSLTRSITFYLTDLLGN